MALSDPRGEGYVNITYITCRGDKTCKMEYKKCTLRTFKFQSLDCESGGDFFVAFRHWELVPIPV